jgi:hypothetical protein
MNWPQACPSTRRLVPTFDRFQEFVVAWRHRKWSRGYKGSFAERRGRSYAVRITK